MTISRVNLGKWGGRGIGVFTGQSKGGRGREEKLVVIEAMTASMGTLQGVSVMGRHLRRALGKANVVVEEQGAGSALIRRTLVYELVGLGV